MVAGVVAKEAGEYVYRKSTNPHNPAEYIALIALVLFVLVNKKPIQEELRNIGLI